MAVPSYIITCTGHRLIARDIYECRFTRPREFDFRAGQFVLFDVPLLEDIANIQTRAFSIASAPSEEELLFVIKLKDGGRASKWVAELLQQGDELRIQGPFGNFLLHTEQSNELVFIATSTGIAPFRSQIIDACESGFSRKIDVIFGVRSEEDLFWQKEMELLTQKYSNVFVHFALSAPSESWTGHRGRVQTLVPLIIKDFSRKTVYVCGSPDMTKDVKQLCLEEWKIEKKDLHVEGYI